MEDIVKKIIGLVLFCLLSFTNITHARTYWGAIAVNEAQGVVGESTDQQDENSANKEALKVCQKKSKNNLGKCILVVNFYDSCGGAAWSKKNKSARAALDGNSYEKAARNALKRCLQVEKDPNCQIISGFCTHWDTEEVIWW